MVDPSNERTLTNQLRAYASEKALKGPQRVSRSIHGSGYWHCSREQLYGLLGYEPTDKKYNWQWDLAARTGDALHGMIQQEFVDSGKAVILANGRPAIELTLGSDCLPPDVAREFANYKMGIRIDAVLYGSEPKLHIPVEIKTVAGDYLNGSNQRYFPGRLADYEAQIQAQMHFYRNHITGERSQFGVVYVINRNDVSDRREYLIEYNPRFMEAELERVVSIRDHWLRVQLPEPEVSRKNCGFCNWVSLCPATLKDKREGGYRGK
jgi:hypothetical protein